MLCPRRVNHLAKILLDLCALAGAFCLACLLPFEEISTSAWRLLSLLPAVAGGKLFLLAAAGRSRLSWRHTSLRDAVWLLNWCAVAAIGLLLWRLVAIVVSISPEHSLASGLPVGVILLDLVLSILGLLSVRGAARLWSEYRERKDAAAERVPTLLIGAGRAGAMVAREIAARPDLSLAPVGFLDDDPSLRGMLVGGIPVLGTTAQVGAISKQYDVRQALITIANRAGAAIRRIVETCKASGLDTKIIPPLHELVGGRINLSRIRKVALEDLLRRSPITLDDSQVRDIVKDQTVLVTGAGGSIGSELCRIISGLAPRAIVLVERAENSLFQIHLQLVEMFPGLHIIPCIADICDEDRMESILATHRPSSIFHAAAHKHVPMMELNPCEAVKNNVLGTRALARLADLWGVRRFVMISTDKAVNPTSVMGVSKRVAELFVQSFAQRSTTRFMTVRFGNVLGSAGSVIPIFQEQIAGGGPVTVTHPEMKRYFMTIPEACQLVLQAATMGQGGEIFILDMGEPVKIVDIARDLIHLSGLTPDQDIEIRFTGIRPGEKLFEELFLGEEMARRTAHHRIFIGQAKPAEWIVIERHVRELGELAAGPDVRPVYAKFQEIVPEYEPEWRRLDEAEATPVTPMHAGRSKEAPVAAGAAAPVNYAFES
ncbi:MAG: nucleoside-diphosphate sugar epimerase/dehydratase [Gemmataceae bacterium]